METKNYVYPLLFAGIIFLIYHTTKVNPTVQKLIQPKKQSNGILMEFPENHMDLIPKNGFVKPQHKLLNLLNDISSGNKIYLKDLVKRESYTNKTIPEDLNDVIVNKYDLYFHHNLYLLIFLASYFLKQHLYLLSL